MPFYLVDVLSAYSNRADLCGDLARTVAGLPSEQVRATAGEYERVTVRSSTPPRVRLLADRLTPEEVSKLVACFKDGTTIRELAERFSISTTSVKKLLREHGGRRRG